MAENFPSTSEILETLLENAFVKGKVRANIDIKMFAFLITSMNTRVIEYNIEYLTQKHDGKMIESIDKFLDFLENGIGVQSGGWTPN